MGLRVFPLDGIHIISISDLGPDSDAATRLETADGSGPRSGLCNTCIRELHSGRMALQCALALHRVALDSATRAFKSVARPKIMRFQWRVFVVAMLIACVVEVY